MLTDLPDATARTCGGKASALATLLRHGVPVPDGFVVPFSTHVHAGHDRTGDAGLHDAVARRLSAMGDPPVAVRSSASDEDGTGRSAAGQYESVLGVHGAPAVIDAIGTCRRSARSDRVRAYRNGVTGHGSRDASPAPHLAVLVQRMVDAEVSGVMFTPGTPGGTTRIEASWGLGPGIVGGAVDPEAYDVGPDGRIRRTIRPGPVRLDRGPDDPGPCTADVAGPEQTLPALDDATATALTATGHRIAEILGRPQDIEWALAHGTVWILQSRPVTAPVPPASGAAPAGASHLTGVPGSHGVAHGTARVLHRPADLVRLRRGDVMVCRFTEPAWTPGFGVAGGIVTETGGVLSHAAIVAREYGLPAVLGVPHATTRIPDGALVAVDGTNGTVTVAQG